MPITIDVQNIKRSLNKEFVALHKKMDEQLVSVIAKIDSRKSNKKPLYILGGINLGVTCVILFLLLWRG